MLSWRRGGVGRGWNWRRRWRGDGRRSVRLKRLELAAVFLQLIVGVGEAGLELFQTLACFPRLVAKALLGHD